MLPVLFSALIACSGTSSVVGPDVPDDQRIVSIDVQPSDVELAVGDTTRLSLKGQDSKGSNVSLKNKNVKWSSSDTTVATVDSTGLVQTLGDGSARIDVELATSGKGGPPPRDSARVRGKGKADSGDGSGDGGGEGGDSGGDGDDGTTDDSGSPDAFDHFRAFPEAEGYGAEALTTCDRSDVQVLRVTNLQDSGSGSLRDALSSVRNSILSVVVFDVAGYIDLSSSGIPVSSNCLYIAGQTAPGDGITIRTAGKGLFLKGSVSDVVIRYLRFRGGYHGDNRGHNPLLIGSGHDIVLDHLSLGWTTNYLLGIIKYDDVSWSQPISRISVQRTLLHEVLAAHPTAAQIAGHGPDARSQMSELSLHHNLFAHNHHRNPANDSHGLKLINNVIYNWKIGATINGHASRLDVIANYYKMGPMRDSRYDWEVTWYCNHTNSQPSFYLSGNIGPHNDDPNADNWTGDSRMIACYLKTGDYAGQEIPGWEDYRRTEPLPKASVPVQVQSATEAYRSVLDDAGANARLRCNGEWMPNSDVVDERVINEVANGTGVSAPPETEDDVGGFPSISSGTPCPDSDGDGMPDQFEEQLGFDPTDASDASRDADGDGYSNFEEYLNGTIPK
jgi:pectate lyase